jgi:predicted aldo/keto reductase-like oxidoreductase
LIWLGTLESDEQEKREYPMKRPKNSTVGLDPDFLAAKEKLMAGKISKRPIPKRQYGRTKEKLSIIGFGGMVVKDVAPKQAANFVVEAVDRGVNYFDVAPYYGNAQERLGPALKPYRQNCFLACKTLVRDAAGAAKELKQSLKLLKTDYFDLYQLHALSDLEEVEQAFGPGGAMETIFKAKENGKIRHIGFSAHSEEAAHAAMDHFDFDSILFPLSFPIWIKAKFGPSVYKRAKKAGMGIIGLKAMAHQLWPVGKDRKWDKTFYEPFDEIGQAALGLRFALHLPVTAVFPPGHWELFEMALDLAQAGALTPLNDYERKLIERIARKSEPIFS